MARVEKFIVCNPKPLKINKKEELVEKIESLLKKLKSKKMGKKQISRIEKFIDGILLTMDL
jgi:hypothetical protein